MPDELLQLNQVSFSYQREILTDISLKVHAGEIVALLGPNGAGKSTLLAIACGALKARAGHVLFTGKSLNQCSRREIAQNIALMAQTETVRFPVTALEYVLAGRFAHTVGLGFDSPRDVEIALAALESADVKHFAARPFTSLSSGERQRVALARALAQQPRMLLLDEPTANLDIAHQAQLLRLLQKLTREKHLGVLLVTHEINLAAELADRVALMHKGSLLACGSPHEILTADHLEKVFGVELLVDFHPQSGRPRITMESLS